MTEALIEKVLMCRWCEYFFFFFLKLAYKKSKRSLYRIYKRNSRKYPSIKNSDRISYDKKVRFVIFEFKNHLTDSIHNEITKFPLSKHNLLKDWEKKNIIYRVGPSIVRNFYI